MTGLDISVSVKEQIVSAVITRADGAKENLGVISYWHINPIKRLLHGLIQKIRK